MPKTYLPIETQRQVFKRARGLCEYCWSPAHFASGPFNIEHIIPISRNGTDMLENLALSCPGCNGHKYDKTDVPDPTDGMMVPLFNPRRQHWHDHFRWNEDYTLIIGLTATGRATVDVLQMNRVGVVNLRAVLYVVGKHPPLTQNE